MALDPTDDRYVYLGGAGFGHPGPLLRFDTVTEQAFDVAVWPEYFMGEGAAEARHRFGWTFPIEFSPHDPGRLYVGGERLFASDDRGVTWRAISPDLTRDDPAKQQTSGRPISADTSGAEVYCTIHAFAESPLTPGELWVGTDRCGSAASPASPIGGAAFTPERDRDGNPRNVVILGGTDPPDGARSGSSAGRTWPRRTGLSPC